MVFRTKDPRRYDIDVLTERPNLAAHIGKIAHLWTLVDIQLGLLLASMLRADARSATVMYLKLRGARPHAMDAVAEDILDPSLLSDFRKLMGKVRDIEGSRNDVIHGLWAIDERDPNNLVWIDTALHLQEAIARRAAMHLPVGPLLVEGSWWYEAWSSSKDSERIYGESTFIEIEKRVKSLLIQIAEFDGKVMKLFG